MIHCHIETENVERIIAALNDSMTDRVERIAKCIDQVGRNFHRDEYRKLVQLRNELQDEVDSYRYNNGETSPVE